MSSNVDVKVLLEKGAYFGHKIARTNPKALPYTHKAQNGIYIIDLFKTKEQLEKALNFLKEAGRNNQELLIVATKKIIKNHVAAKAEEAGVHYMTEKWTGGFFTNFPEVYKNIKRINDWMYERDSGGWNSMIKHQRVRKEKILNKMHRLYRGVLKLTEIPQNILIIDVRKEKNALDESLKIKTQQQLGGKTPMSIMGIADTNADPTQLDAAVVMNDDSTPALEYVLEFMFTAYQEGKKLAGEAAVKAAAKEEAKAAKEAKKVSKK